MQTCDRLIIGAGIYGLYAALRCACNGEHVVVVERDDQAFSRATYVNQARVHMGYHYPRSLSTATKSAGYFNRFVRDYRYCILAEFDQVYATSSRFSWTSASEFERFCRAAEIPCEAVPPSRYFNEGMCDGAFLTKEYTYDASILRQRLVAEVEEHPRIVLSLHSPVVGIENNGTEWLVRTESGSYVTPKVLNATYASVNSIHSMIGADPFPIKYELCEIILCDVDDALKGTGLTVMDGPFFSIMPFGKTGLHSLTSVTFTPHMTSRSEHPTFSCQSGMPCKPTSLGNCNLCAARPRTAWDYMGQLARKYMRPKYGFEYRESLFSMKPILKASEVDDSRPTVIRRVHTNPEMISVLSGKVNTIYDLDSFLDGKE